MGVHPWSQARGDPTQPPELLTLEAFGNQPVTPNLKPDYNQPAYYTGVDAAKRHLFGDSHSKPVSLEIWKKVVDLGRPYHLKEEDKTAGQDRQGNQPLRYLSAKTSAPFFAAALHDANMPLTFPAEQDSADTEFGMANRAPEKLPPRPYVPVVVKTLETYIKKLRDTCNIPRLKWAANSFPAPPEADREFFQPTEVPKACWQQMQDDAYSWCQPERAPPAGVERAASTSTYKFTSSKPQDLPVE